MPAPDDYVVPPNALVAARIDDTDKDTFILARVIEFVRKRNRYEVVDVDTSDKECVAAAWTFLRC